MFAAAALACPLPVAALAFLEGLGAGEMLLVAVIGLLLFGGKGLPDMARTLGKVVREFKKATQGVEDEVRRVMEEPPPTPRRRPAPRIVTPAAPPQSASLPAAPAPPAGDSAGASPPPPISAPANQPPPAPHHPQA